MIERLQVYRLSVDISTPVRLSEERQTELATAVLEALRLLDVAFWVDDDSNQLIRIDYAKTIDRVQRYQ